MSNERYMQRGVSASKEDVHNAIKNVDKGLYPQAFCKIIPDLLGGDPNYCNLCMPMGLVQSRLLPTSIGAKPATSPFGKG